MIVISTHTVVVCIGTIERSQIFVAVTKSLS